MSWSITITNPAGVAFSDLPLAQDISFSKTLNGIGEASFTLDIFDPSVSKDLLHTGRNVVTIRKNQTAFFAGRLVNWRLNAESGKIDCLAYSWEWLLTKALLEAGDDSVDVGYAGDDIGVIISAIITEHQAKTGGNYGFVEGEIQTSRNADRKDYKILSNRWELIQNLTKVKNGVDFEIFPDKTWNVFYPRKGVEKPNVELNYPNNILSYSYEEDATDLITEIFIKGDGLDDAISLGQSDDATQITAYGLLQDSRSYSSDVVATLDEYGDGLLAQKKQPMITIDSITYIAGVRGAPNVGDFRLGDTVRIKIKHGNLIDVNRMFRIERYKIQIDSEGIERVTIGGSYA